MRELEHREFPWGTLTVVETDDICSYLSSKYSRFPDGGRIYHNHADVTPKNEDAIARLRSLSGEFTITVTPMGAPIVPLLIVTALSITLGILLRPDLSVDANNWDPGSPTNSPGRIPNKERIGKRVPDLYGKVRHTPDLIAPTITRYESNREVEYSYLCVGRGRMSDTRFDVFDGGVDISEVFGYSAHVWPPGSSIYSTPQHTFGRNFDPSIGYRTPCWKELDGARYEAVPPRNNHNMNGVANPTYPDISDLAPIAASSGAWPWGHVYSNRGSSDGFNTYDVDYDFSVQYPPGSRIRLQNLRYTGSAPGGLPPIPDISGDYTVINSIGSYLALDIPDDKKDAWETLQQWQSFFILVDIVQIEALLEYTVPVAYGAIDITFEAPNGLYMAGNSHYGVTRNFEVKTIWTRTDGGGSPITTTTSATVNGNSRTKGGYTLRVLRPVTLVNRECSVDITIKSTSTFNDTTPGWEKGSEGRVDLRSIAAIIVEEDEETPYADEVTTMLVRVETIPGALQLRSRGVEVETSKQLRRWDGALIDEPYNWAWYIILEDMGQDQRIGRMASVTQGHTDWSTVRNEQVAYYNSDSEMTNFSWVFDDTNTTFEDMIQTIAQAFDMIPYRVGKNILFRFMRPESTPVLLFNARNKIPNTEQRIVRFGNDNDIDQMRVPYVDVEDQYEKKTESVPAGTSAYTPADLTIAGLVYSKQANVIAARNFYRSRLEHTTVQFDATEEAALLVSGDMIMVTDGTRANVIEGELTDVDGTTIVLQNSVTLRSSVGDTTNFVIFLQQPDGTVVVRDIVSPVHYAVNELTISSALPAASTSIDNYARTTFYIVEDTATAGDFDKFIVEKITPGDKNTYTVTAKNYDEDVYQDDPVS